MFILIASDSPSVSTKLRKALALHGHECPITHLVGLDQTLSMLESTSAAVNLLFLLLPADESRSLSIIRRARTLTSARLVAVGRTGSSKHILEALHAGADDYLDEEAELGGQVRLALDRMELRSETASAGKLIVVTSASGGCGASLVAANLAVKLAQRGSKCGLIDVAAGFGDLGSLFNVAPRYTIGDLLRSQESIDRTMFEQSVIVHSSGVSLLPAANPFEDIEATDGRALGSIIALSRSMYPWTVVDLDARSERNVETLKHSSTIVLAFRFDFTALCNTRRLLDAWKSLQVESERIVLVGNRLGQAGEVPLDQARTLLGQEILVRLPEDTLHVNVAANCGNPIVLESPKIPISRALSQLCERISGSAAPAEPSAAQAGNESGWLGNLLVKKVAGILFC